MGPGSTCSLVDLSSWRLFTGLPRYLNIKLVICVRWRVAGVPYFSAPLEHARRAAIVDAGLRLTGENGKLIPGRVRVTAG